jgi:hypothetical protein
MYKSSNNNKRQNRKQLTRFLQFLEQPCEEFYNSRAISDMAVAHAFQLGLVLAGLPRKK